jgi:hypothetical protein
MNLRSAFRGVAIAVLLGLPVLAQSTVPPNLISQWHFDEGTGMTVADSAGASTATLVGSGAWIVGIWGAAVVPDGTTGYADLGAQAALNIAANSPFSISAWFAAPATEVAGPIISFRHSVNDQPVIDLCIGFDGGGTANGVLMALVRDDTGGAFARVTSGATMVNDGFWHHLALTRNAGAQIELFLDGVSLGTNSGAASGGAITTDDRAFGAELRWIGQNANTADQRFLFGAIEEVQFYGRQLSLADVQTLAAPAAPINVTAAAGDGTVTLTWNAVANAGAYTIRRSTSPTGPFAAVAGSPTTATTYVDTGLTNGTTYYYIINSVRGPLISVDSATVSATPQVRVGDDDDSRCGCGTVSTPSVGMISVLAVLLGLTLALGRRGY